MTPGPSERRNGIDFFGNTTVETAHRASTTDLDIIVKARVRRTVATGTLDLSPLWTGWPR